MGQNEDAQNRMNNFSADYLKRDGSLAEKCIERRNLVSDVYASGFLIEGRTSDPGSPVVGQIWIRTDL